MQIVSMVALEQWKQEALAENVFHCIQFAFNNTDNI